MTAGKHCYVRPCICDKHSIAARSFPFTGYSSIFLRRLLKQSRSPYPFGRRANCLPTSCRNPLYLFVSRFITPHEASRLRPTNFHSLAGGKRPIQTAYQALSQSGFPTGAGISNFAIYNFQSNSNESI